MEKLGLRSMKYLEHYRTLSKNEKSADSLGIRSTISSADSLTLGSFGNLKNTAERLLKDQATVKADLEMTNSKLKRSVDVIQTLEEKIQSVHNENSMLKAKQSGDDKLWEGLESKFLSVKTVCDHLTETLHQLVCQVQNAENDKCILEKKQIEREETLEKLQLQMNSLSFKLNSSEEKYRHCEGELMELRVEGKEMEKLLRDNRSEAEALINEKDSQIYKFEETIVANGKMVEDLNSKLRELHLGLQSKEDAIKHLRFSYDNLEKEKEMVKVDNEKVSNKLLESYKNIKEFSDLINKLATDLSNLYKESEKLTEKFAEFMTASNLCIRLLQQEKCLFSTYLAQKYEKLHDQWICILSERDILQLVNNDLNDKNIELHRIQEFSLFQHGKECCQLQDKIQKFETESRNLNSSKDEMKILVSELEKKNDELIQSSNLSESKMVWKFFNFIVTFFFLFLKMMTCFYPIFQQDLMQKISGVEFENRNNIERLQAEMLEKVEETDVLQQVIGKHEQNIHSMKIQADKLQEVMGEKEAIIQKQRDENESLKTQNIKIQTLLVAAENKLAEDKKHFDSKLENKQSELSKHLKEISQRNDQAISEMRKKYETEKLEIVNNEREKATKLVRDVEVTCEQKLEEFREKSQNQLKNIQEEHASLVNQIQEEYDQKEQKIIADLIEEARHLQLEAENKLSERVMVLNKEHEVEIRSLRSHYEDECKKLQDELIAQKSREDRQRALLELQWKVIEDQPQEDQEVNSKKSYCSSLNKKVKSHESKKPHLPLMKTESQRVLPLLRASQISPSGMLNNIEKVNGSAPTIPHHSRKVTHREYEVETSNGQTITKRKKTKRTVMYEDPMKHKRVPSPLEKASAILKGNNKRVKEGERRKNIGDLFSEGSLNPYADDPYAFD